MASRQTSAVLRFIRAIPPARGALPDRELLERFLAQHDEAAFAALVARHGPLVLGVCRRVLRHAEDAEDAFQAAFLVLVRKANSIAKRESVGSWLYGVASRIALKAKIQSARRRALEKELCDLPAPEPSSALAEFGLGPALEEELNRLPAKYRILLVLCYLEGKTTAEAARQVGCPRGTVLSRLARAREQLRLRLAHRGLALPAALGGAVLAQRAASAAVPAALASSTVQAALALSTGKATGGLISAHAAALVKGALQAMLLTKLRIGAGVLLAVAMLGTGVGLVTQHAQARKAGDEPGPELVSGDANAIRLPAEAAAKLGVRTGEVKSRGVARPRLLHLAGSLAFDPQFMVRIRIRSAPAEVLEVKVQAGSRVKKDDLLAVLSSSELAANKSELVDAVTQLRLDRDILDSVEKAAARGAVPEVTVLNARRNVVSDSSAVARAERTLLMRQLPEKDIKALKAYAESLAQPKAKRDPEKEKAWARVEVRAPRDGVVVEKNVSIGEIVVDGTIAVFMLADVSRLRVIANVPEDDLHSLQALKPEQRRWKIQPAEGQPVDGQIDQIGLVIDPNQHTAVVTGTAPNPEGRLRAGQFIRATITLPMPHGDLTIPASALVEDGREIFVLVQPDPAKPVYVQRRVVLVRRGHDTAHVRFLLKSGERVVTAGALELKAALDDLKAQQN